jgi:hypothetical protein
MIRMTLLLLIAALCQGFEPLSAQPIHIEKVRVQYFSIGKDPEAALVLYKSLTNLDVAKDPLMLAYRGASSAAAAGTVSGVHRKLQYFNRGKSDIEKAVGLRPLDAEIRFLRLATQVKAPGFLGYTGDIKNDKAIIFKTLSSVAANHPNAYLYHRICLFVQLEVPLENNEKDVVNQLIIKFNTKK